MSDQFDYGDLPGERDARAEADYDLATSARDRIQEKADARDELRSRIEHLNGEPEAADPNEWKAA